MTIKAFIRRLAFIVPQLIGISLVTFILVQLIPGDPARQMLGPLATQDSIDSLRSQMGLDKSLPQQYGLYVWHALHGQLGTSWYTTNSVAHDIADRLPATLELISYSLLLAIVVGVPLGIRAARRPRGLSDRIAFGYGLIAGALADFWLALILILVFYVKLRWVAAPNGRLDLGIAPPDKITGFYTFDALVTGQWAALSSAFSHLLLPVTTLALINVGPILKMTRSTMQQTLDADSTRYARLCGLPERTVTRYAIRAALSPIITLIAVLYGFLVGGAVLVETIFGWNGVGQYAVQGVLNADFAVIQGFVLVAAVISLVVYFIVDVVYAAIDPRIKL